MPDAPEQQTQDPQDKQFAAAAAGDQERVDELIEQGVDEDDLPDEAAPGPRAAGKAPPGGEPA